MAAKYERVTADLRRAILTGRLNPGDPLPAQPVLAEQYRVSLPVVQQALGILEGEGLIDQVQGVGTRVRKPPRHRVRRKAGRYQWEKDRARLSEEERSATGATEHDTGLDYSDLDFAKARYEQVAATDELAGAFGVKPGTMLLHRAYGTRIRSEGVALSLVDSYLVYEVAAANPELLDGTNEPWPGGTMHQLYTLGIEVDAITDEITARPPRAGESEALGIGPGVSVVVLRKTTTDTDGRVVEVSDVIMPGDRTILEYRTRLERW